MFRLWICAVLGAIVFVGCGKSGPKLAVVEGNVTLDGKPLAYKSIVFFPVDGTVGKGAGSVTDSEGKYTLNAVVFGAVKDYHGCPPGSYRVVLTEPPGPILQEENADSPVVVGFPRRTKIKNRIPFVYTTKQTTPLVCDVSESGGVFDFNLELTSDSR